MHRCFGKESQAKSEIATFPHMTSALAVRKLQFKRNMR